MKCTFACKKVTLNNTIKEYAEKNISKLDRYFREAPSAFVTFSVEKNRLCTVEVTIRGGNTLFRAQTEAPDGDMRSAIDAACGYIERQILKNKTRLAKRLRSDAFPVPAPDSDFEVTEEKEFNIVRTKRFAVKPMSNKMVFRLISSLQLNMGFPPPVCRSGVCSGDFIRTPGALQLPAAVKQRRFLLLGSRSGRCTVGRSRVGTEQRLFLRGLAPHRGDVGGIYGLRCG